MPPSLTPPFTPADPQVPDAIGFIAEDHDRIRRSLQDARRACREDASDPVAAAAAITRFARDMQIHDTLEAELLYPLAAMSDIASDALTRGALEHTIINALDTELQSSLASDDDRRRILAEIGERFDRHVREEEEVLLPALAECDLDLATLGAELAKRRDELVRALARFQAGADTASDAKGPMRALALAR